MYGLVNRAIEDMLRAAATEEAWAQIRASAGLPGDGFLRMEQYDDAVTYRLLGAANAALGIPVPTLLRAFGRHWITYTDRSGYGPLLDLGETLEEQLQQIDTLHARLSASYPDMAAPTFRCRRLSSGTLEVTYRSRRAGLGPMVHGLIEGLCERFGHAGAVSHVRHDDVEGGALDVFEVAA